MATDHAKVSEWAAHVLPIPRESNGMGGMEEPHCKDTLTIGIAVNQRAMVVDSGFTLTETACDTVRAAAAAAAALAKDRPVLAAYTITAADIAAELSDDGALNQEHLHCAQMAEIALKKAVADFCADRKKQA